MAKKKSKRVAPEEKVPAQDPAEVANEDLKQVSGGASEFYRKSRQTAVKIPGGVDESAPTRTEPSPAINISRR